MILLFLWLLKNYYSEHLTCEAYLKISSRSLLQYWRTLDFSATYKHWEAGLLYVFKDLFLQKNIKTVTLKRKRSQKVKNEDRTGGLWHGSRVERMVNHESLNDIKISFFQNHENK